MSGKCNIFNLEKRYSFDEQEKELFVRIDIKILFFTITIRYRKEF